MKIAEEYEKLMFYNELCSNPESAVKIMNNAKNSNFNDNDKSVVDEVKDVFFKTQRKYHVHKPLQRLS